MKNENTLTSAEKAELRGVAQRLNAHIHVGKNGLTPQVIKEIAQALKKHELVKIKFIGDREEIQQLCKQIEETTDSICVGGVGKVSSFYKQKPKAAEKSEEEDDEAGFEE